VMKVTVCGSSTPTGTGSPRSPPNTRRGQLADLELRHRRGARCEDRIRCVKDTRLRNPPLHDFAQNQLWCAIVALACELTAWAQMLALPGHSARRWEPNDSDSACSRSPGDGLPPAPRCTCPDTPPGHSCSPRRSPP
jgi:hypothetical protein